MEQVLLPLPEGGPAVPDDSVQPDGRQDRLHRDLPAEELHQEDLRVHRQEILLRPHSRGQVCFQ